MLLLLPVRPDAVSVDLQILPPEGVGGGGGPVEPGGAVWTMCELAKRDTFISLRLNRKIIINIIATTLLGESLACLQSESLEWNLSGLRRPADSLFLARPCPGFDLPTLCWEVFIFISLLLFRSLPFCLVWPKIFALLKLAAIVKKFKHQ